MNCFLMKSLLTEGLKEGYGLIRQRGQGWGYRYIRKTILGRGKIMYENLGTGEHNTF